MMNKDINKLIRMALILVMFNVLSSMFNSVNAQRSMVLDLQQTIAIANDSSLEAFRTKNMYLSSYWEYRSYRANRLPSLTLNLTPAQYYRDITRRYDLSLIHI